MSYTSGIGAFFDSAVCMETVTDKPCVHQVMQIITGAFPIKVGKDGEIV